jgi:hypothetical protein
MVEAASVRPCRRQAWFDPAIKTMLHDAGALDTMSGPREFEQVTAELLSADMLSGAIGNPSSRSRSISVSLFLAAVLVLPLADRVMRFPAGV